MNKRSTIVCPYCIGNGEWICEDCHNDPKVQCTSCLRGLWECEYCEGTGKILNGAKEIIHFNEE